MMLKKLSGIFCQIGVFCILISVENSCPFKYIPGVLGVVNIKEDTGVCSTENLGLSDLKWILL